MTLTEPRPAVDAFVAQAQADAEHAIAVLRATGTLTANGTITFAERLPGEDAYVLLASPGPWSQERAVQPRVLPVDATATDEEPDVAYGFGRLLALRPELSTVVHLDAPHLGAWAQTQQDLPIRYVPVQRWTLGNTIPAYVDRTQTQIDFILERLDDDPHTPAILEGNGGATIWGREGLLATAEYVQIVEEGAQFQLLAQALGGSQPYGPGVLAQQWAMSGLTAEARRLGLLP